MNRERLLATYDRLAPTYDRSVGACERWFLKDLRAAFGAELRGEALEVALGSGLSLPFYTAAVTRAVGVDLSHGMLTRAAHRAAALRRPLALVQADAERLPFPDASFDTVAVSLALCTVPRPAAALREMARVCRPAGRIVLLEHVRSPVAPVAFAQRLLSPVQERLIGCHLARDTMALLPSARVTIRSESSRFFSVFRLVVAVPGDGCRDQ